MNQKLRITSSNRLHLDLIKITQKQRIEKNFQKRKKTKKLGKRTFLFIVIELVSHMIHSASYINDILKINSLFFRFCSGAGCFIDLNLLSNEKKANWYDFILILVLNVCNADALAIMFFLVLCFLICKLNNLNLRIYLRNIICICRSICVRNC